MNSVTKRLLIIAGALIIVGTVLGATAITMVGFNWESLSTRLPYEEKSYTYDLKSGVTALSVSDVSSDVIFVSSNDDFIKINCFENENESYDIKLSEDGHLSVNYFKPKRWYEYIGFNFNHQKRTLTVSVPAKFTGTVGASTVSGDITMSNLGLSDALVVNTTSGEITLKDIAASGQTSMTSVSGNIELDKMNINGDLKLGTTSGDTDISSSQIAGNLSLKSISGDLNAMKTRVNGNASLKSTSGEVEFKDLTSNNISISTISGNVSGNILGDSKDYTIKADTVSGNKNLPLSANGNKLLNVSTTSGDIDISFTSAI